MVVSDDDDDLILLAWLHIGQRLCGNCLFPDRMRLVVRVYLTT